MSDKPDPILQQKEQQQLKTQLLWRLGIAGTLIAGVLGAITWLDQDEKNLPPEVQIPQIAPTASAIVAAPSPEPVVEAEIASAPLAASQASTAAPTVAPSPVASTAPNQTPIETISNAPTKRPTEPAPIKKAVATPTPAYKTTAAPILKLDAVQAATTPPPAKFPIPSNTQLGYSVQAGVFLHSSNAEKLLAQIQTAGIPAYLETRVQIGPFKTKTEADEAVKKLRKLGIEPIVKTQ